MLHYPLSPDISSHAIMVDPVSIAKAIGTLLDLTKTVLGYVKDVYLASKDRQKLFDEVASTQAFLEQLNEKSEHAKWRDTIVMNILAAPQGPLQQLTNTLEPLKEKLKPSDNRLKNFGKAVAWPFKKEEMVSIFSSLERSKSLLTLALQRDLV